ncbi:hypothetical protein [Methylomicrobium agile]|uniref:hypothetical protein n=1 Tax=Methylomicrobium agile TaxID=39774 RepID=UPI0012F6E556|nr:hypothetical protein [Methylomicrobium agile]
MKNLSFILCAMVLAGCAEQPKRNELDFSAEGRYMVYGAGAEKCAQVSEDYRNGGQVIYSGWIAGYITAINESFSAINNTLSPDITNGLGLNGSLKAAIAYVDVYCGINPHKQLANAMSDFVVLMLKKQQDIK